KNTYIETVLDLIEKQSEYTFFYKRKDLKRIQPVDVNVHNAAIGDVLTELFTAERGVAFQIEDKVVMLKARPSLTRLETIEPTPVILQDIEIRGSVTDSTGRELSGVSITVQGRSSIGMATDNN